jgi:hypothetical protein
MGRGRGEIGGGEGVGFARRDELRPFLGGREEMVA